MSQIGDRRIRHLTKSVTLTYIPSNDYGKNGDNILVKSDKSNSIEEFIKQDGRWVSLSTGRGSDDSKRRAGRKGTSTASGSTVQNITINQAEGTTGTGLLLTDHAVLTNLESDDHPQYVHNTTARTISASHVLSGNPSFSGTPVFAGIPNFTKADGTNPFTVTSTTKVANLNVDKLDGYDESAFFKLADNESITGNTTFSGTATFNGTVAMDGGATGVSPPFTVDSTNEVLRLNAAALSGADWDAPLAIGNTTAAAGTFTTLTGTTLDVNGNMTITGSITGDAAASGDLSISSGGDTLIEGTTFSGDNVVIPGNLTVSGDTVTFTTSTVQAEDKNIYLAYNNPGVNDAAKNAVANAGGMSLKAAEDKHFVWYSATDRWTASEDVEAPGLYLKTNALTKISLHDTASSAMSYIQTTNLGDIILKAPATQGVAIDADNNFGGTTFTSGFAGNGWRITKDASNEYSAEFDNLIVRGTMSVYELLIQQIRASNGSLLIGSADKVVAVEVISGSSYKFTVEADSSTNFIHFTEDDLIIAQKWTGGDGSSGNTNIVKRVRATVTETSNSTGSSLTSKEFKATLYSTDTVATSDMPLDFVRVGSTDDDDRQGGIYLTSEDSGAPFIDIFNDVDEWAAWRLPAKTKARLGRLDGITHNGTSLSGYGLFSDRVYLTGNITATSGYIGSTDNGWAISSGSIENGNVRLSSQYETIRLGAVTDFTNDDNTRSGVFMGRDGNKYEFFAGQETEEYIHWNGTNLLINGDITVTNTGDFAPPGAEANSSSQDNPPNYQFGPDATLDLSSVSTPTNAGLYLGSNYMGYYNGGWKTYMDSSGNFYLGGTAGALTWASGTLTVTGELIVTNPDDFANPNAFGLNSCALVLNTRSSDGVANPGELALVKIDQDGTPVYGENGFIIWEGEQIEVPHVPAVTDYVTIVTGTSGTIGFIIFDTTSASFTANGKARNVVFGWKDGTQWKYDNNSGTPTNFTPDNEMVAIGWMQTHLTTSDGALVGGALFDPVPLELASVPGATNDDLAGTKTQTFIQDAAPTAITVGDIWIETDNNNKLYRASAVGSGNWVAATPDSDINTTTIIGNTITTGFINALAVNAETVSASWLYAGSLTAGQIQTSSSAFLPALSYIFRSNAHGFTDFGLDVVNGASYTTITHTQADAGFRKQSINFDGLANRYIKIRFRRQGGSAWDGSCYWIGEATSVEQASYRKDFADPTGGTISNQWYVLLLDMWDLTTGGDSWKDDNHITSIRIDFGNGTGDEFDIDFIMLGDVSADSTGTFIDSSGVYTGILTAGQVNAVNITANTIDMDSATVTGTLAAGNIDVSGIVTATSVNAVAISADSITAGTLSGRTVQTTAGHSKLDDTSGFGNLTPTETQIGGTQYNTNAGSAVPATNPSSLASTTWSSYGTVCFRFDLKCDNIQEGGVDYGVAKVQARKNQEGTWSNFGSPKYINFISPDGQWKNYEINYSTTELDNAIVDNILLLITEATAPGYVGGGYGGGSGTATSELRIRYYKHIGIIQKTVINRAGFRTYSTPSNYAKFGSGSNYLKGQTNISGNLSVYGEAFKLTGGSWLSTSDERIKNINGDYSKGLSVIKDIDIVNYEYKHDLGKEYVGVIAQKLEKVLPEAVSERVSMGYEDLRVVNESPVLWTLVNAVKELSDEVDKIKKKKRCKCGRK